LNGPEHYREAERLQRHAAELVGTFEGARSATPAEQAHRAAVLADAQIHATLALAAAIGMSASLPNPEAAEWRKAAGIRLDGRLGQ